MTRIAIFAASVAIFSAATGPAFAASSYMGTSGHEQDNADQGAPFASARWDGSSVSAGVQTFGYPQEGQGLLQRNDDTSGSTFRSTPYLGTSDHGQDNADANLQRRY